jgi:hypothetical protein
MSGGVYMVGVGRLLGSLFFKAVREAVRLDLNIWDFRRGAFFVQPTDGADAMDAKVPSSDSASEHSSESSSRRRGWFASTCSRGGENARGSLEEVNVEEWE